MKETILNVLKTFGTGLLSIGLVVLTLGGLILYVAGIYGIFMVIMGQASQLGFIDFSSIAVFSIVNIYLLGLWIQLQNN